MRQLNIYGDYVKRIMDIIISIIALLVLSPVMIVVAILVKIKLGSPILFSQKRPGKDEKIFSMYKFRTMTDEVDKNGNLMPDDIRLTRFGRILRSTSLDELPELFNIIKGDMSIVGPRPLLVEYLNLYNDDQKKRHNVRPGLTGLAQVKGRNSISWKEKFELDIEYCSNITFFNDTRIMLITVKKVFARDGINSDLSVTSSKFNGRN